METLHVNGIGRIAAERRRQVEVKGCSSAGDDLYLGGELARAAFCYTETAAIQSEKERTNLPACFVHKYWPWARLWWKPSNDPIRNLEKAGALIAAEIDRLQRKEGITAISEFPGLDAIDEEIERLRRLRDSLYSSSTDEIQEEVDRAGFAREQHGLTRKLLDEAAEFLGEQEIAPSTKDWWKRYFRVTGDHMVLTEDGWEPGLYLKDESADPENLPEIHDEVNPPGWRLVQLRAAKQA